MPPVPTAVEHILMSSVLSALCKPPQPPPVSHPGRYSFPSTPRNDTIRISIQGHELLPSRVGHLPRLLRKAATTWCCSHAACVIVFVRRAYLHTIQRRAPETDCRKTSYDGGNPITCPSGCPPQRGSAQTSAWQQSVADLEIGLWSVLESGGVEGDLTSLRGNCVRPTLITFIVYCGALACIILLCVVKRGAGR
ncbi:hypothetical protein P280DRAFT_102297 [Massarina eburnea CBS 473.64]|uniref:Uncharacterized protein n=1 Tax=Massarina eburnea CBS 473.64 TaxID=1395130 RepID=A0A6A6RSP3_9PLEO|nr:hypothetical protein P280DRAFT_102297 [Massarina eburnea CBS 473.64]